MNIAELVNPAPQPERKKRKYHVLTDADRIRMKEEYTKAPRGQKTKVAKKLADEIGCSTQWCVKVASGLA